MTRSPLAYHGYLQYQALGFDDLRRVADKIQRLARQVGVFPRRFALYVTMRLSALPGARIVSGKIAGQLGARVKYRATMHLTRDPREFFAAATNWVRQHADTPDVRILSFRVHAISDAPKQAPRTPRRKGPVKIGGKRPRGSTAQKTAKTARG